MRLAAFLNKVAGFDPLAVPAPQAVAIATAGGAAVLGMAGVTGEIAPGRKADIAIFDMTAPHWYPRHDRLSLLTYAAAAADVDTVIVDGRVLMEGRRLLTIDEEKVKSEANRRGLRLVGK